MSRVSISERARNDLEEIWHYVATDNVEAADRLVAGIEARFRILADSPRMGRARDDLAPGFRYFPVENYLILYRMEADGIGIVRVLHAARFLDALGKGDASL
jgi:toxin ParE1/3/4